MKDNENLKLVMRREGDKNEPIDRNSDNLKVTTGTAVRSEDQKHAESIIVEELIEVEKRSSNWIIKYQPNRISEHMNSLPKTNTYGWFSSPTASTVTEITFNTVC